MQARAAIQTCTCLGLALGLALSLQPVTALAGTPFPAAVASTAAAESGGWWNQILELLGVGTPSTDSTSDDGEGGSSDPGSGQSPRRSQG
jgi:hypothetical protein